VCLFGLSGDPPTGRGGHVGIVEALLLGGVDDDDDGDIQSHLHSYFDEIRILPVYRHTFSVRVRDC